MPELLFLLTLPETQRTRYRDGIRAAFPAITVNVVDHYSKVDPYIETADVLVTFGPDMADVVLQKARRLKWVQSLGIGVDGIVDQPSLGPQVIVTNMRGFHGPPVAEAALLSMLALARGLPRSIRSQIAAKWDRFPARTLNDSTVVIVGVGGIAATLAPRCRAFGMKVVGVSSSPRTVEGFDVIVARQELESAVRDADFLVLLTPYTDETRHIVNARVLAAMKPGGFLVNVARGGVIDEAALIEAMQRGHLAGAALDVFQTEPLPADHPFWSMPNVIVTAHLGGLFDRYTDHALPILCENLGYFLSRATGKMKNVVRKP